MLMYTVTTTISIIRNMLKCVNMLMWFIPRVSQGFPSFKEKKKSQILLYGPRDNENTG